MTPGIRHDEGYANQDIKSWIQCVDDGNIDSSCECTKLVSAGLIQLLSLEPLNNATSVFNYAFFVVVVFGHAACRILVPRPGVEAVSPAVEEWSLNHWPTREVLHKHI